MRVQKTEGGDWQPLPQNFFDPYPLTALIALIINRLRLGAF
jgi:hypothetical protein